MKFTLFLGLIFAAFPAFATTFLTAQGGYFALSQEKAEKNDVYPTGTSYGAGVGFRKEFYEFEALFLKAKGTGEINHDNSKNSIIHDQSSILLNLNFYITKRLYARMGYAVHKINQTLEKETSAARASGATAAYGLEENKVCEGINFGVGFTILQATDFAVYLQTERMSISKESSAWNSSLGVRIYL